MTSRNLVQGKEVVVPDPPLAHSLFSTTKFAWLWTILRIWLGYEWLTAGWHKVTDARWMSTGEALKGFWTRAVTVPDAEAVAKGARPVIAFDWYRGFIQFMLDNGWYTWFAKLIAVGELLIGVALIVGAFVGISAFFGALLNWNFIMAGTASTNALLFLIAVLLMMAWKVAGWYGLDRWLLRYIGTPWKWSNDVVKAPPATPART